MPVKTWSTPVTTEEKRKIPCNLCGSLSFKPSLLCEGFSYICCTSCGLVQMNPQPLKEEIDRRYSARYGEDYLSYELANEKTFLNLQLLALKDASFDSLEKEFSSHKGTKARSRDDYSSLPDLCVSVPPCEPKRILDIGCAVGSLLEELRNRGWETTGVEISLPQAEYARQKRNLDIRSLPLEENKFPPDYFDAILASHLIEHLNDPAALVNEVRRILVPGGRFFCTTPNIDGFQSRLFRERWRSAIFDHLYLFSAKTLSRLLLNKGFTIEKIATWGGLAAGTAPLPVKRIFDKAAKRFGLGDVMIVKAAK